MITLEFQKKKVSEEMNATSPDKNGFLVDVIHLLDDAAQTKAKLNHFCSYFSKWLRENESRFETNSSELKRLRAWALASYVSLSLYIDMYALYIDIYGTLNDIKRLSLSTSTWYIK